MTLLEGLALWEGATQVVAAHVDEAGQGCFERIF